MTPRLNGLSGLRDVRNTGEASNNARVEAGGFSDALERMDASLRNAEQLAADQAAGKQVEIHDLVLGQQQALLAMQSAVAIRNTAINAYRELMRATEGG